MHELSLCLSLMQQVEAIAHEHDASRVNRITLSIGPLSGVEPDLLKHAYPLATAGTVAVDAELVIETTEVVVRCSQCEHETTVTPNKLLCGSCGDFQTRVISGDELTLMRVELDRGVMCEFRGALSVAKRYGTADTRIRRSYRGRRAGIVFLYRLGEWRITCADRCRQRFVSAFRRIGREFPRIGLCRSEPFSYRSFR